MEQELEGIGVSATGGIDTVNGVVIGSADIFKTGKEAGLKTDGKNIPSSNSSFKRCQCGGSWRNVESCSRPSECY